MEPDLPPAMRAALQEMLEARHEYRGLVMGGYIPFELNLTADDYATAGYYELGPDERDISGPGLTALRAMGGSLEARVNRVLYRPCVNPETKKETEFLTQQLTNGWSLVPSPHDCENLWWHLGTDESTYLGMRLRLGIEADEEL